MNGRKPAVAQRTSVVAAVVAFLLGLGGIVATSTVAGTSAAWTDNAFFSIPVQTGTWAVAPVPATCSVTGAGASATCSVSSIVQSAVGSWGGKTHVTAQIGLSYVDLPPGSGHGIVMAIHLSDWSAFNGIDPSQAVVEWFGGSSYSYDQTTGVLTLSIGNWYSGTGTATVAVGVAS